MSTDPETWRRVWSAASLVLIGGEMLVRGTQVVVNTVVQPPLDEGVRP